MSPDQAVVAAIVPLLKAAGTAAGDRIFDRPPKGAAWPYVVIGERQDLDRSTDCTPGAEIWLTLHVWSNAVGAGEASGLCHAIRQVLDGHEATLTDHRLVFLDFVRSEVFQDANPELTHGVITFHAITEEI